MAGNSQNTTYVVLGANKGIGLGLVQALLARPQTTVVGVVRDPVRASHLEEQCSSVPKGEGSILHALAVDVSRSPGRDDLKDFIKTKLPSSIGHVDAFISSIGHTGVMKPALETTAEEMRDHYEVNTIAPLMLFQAFWPLMEASTESGASSTPKKVFFLSSSVGCIGDWMEPIPGGAYGPSKAALNWIVRKLHFELQDKGIVSVAVHPGWVQTEMGDMAAKSWNYPGKPPLTVAQSVEGVLGVIDGASRENSSGKFLSYDGKEVPW
ncbi:hypothetical protein PV08_05646 [Exophiala spinifera]|uniref:Uncharacterized protein n=1 Tax=Exophiala spinifera TaxID=91928 RepID=A0A0D2B9I0_9EURO|nr:uncharacterized protein PV08_05646 [Exophiala spinifera]KIW15598.1 hypothetical protein PV08_05646 [Exophiala spinifera]